MSENKITAYVRKNDEIGIRNYVLVISSVVCANGAVNLIKRKSDTKDLVAVTHQHGCSQGGADKKQTLRTLRGIAGNPNVAAVLVVGLGCEVIKPEEIVKQVADKNKPFEIINIQEQGGVENTAEKGREIINSLNDRKVCMRESVNIENLILGLECGGSDSFSGLTANPAVGKASDMLIEKNGTVILSEVPEMIGAENVLAKRCINSKVKDELLSVVKNYEEKALESGIDIREANPTPGNKAGGITTIEEKSLGCIYKGGTTEVKQVVDYGEHPTVNGLVIMNTPGNDVESITGMAAGGAQIIAFTTGRGTPAGCSVAPTIKIATNSKAFSNMVHDIDLNAGMMIDKGISRDKMGEIIYEELLEVAEGKRTKAENLNQFDFSINRIGPTF